MSAAIPARPAGSVYSDEAAFQEHLASAHFKDFDAATAASIESKTVAAWHRHD